jgi:hypothetical protein
LPGRPGVPRCSAPFEERVSRSTHTRHHSKSYVDVETRRCRHQFTRESECSEMLEVRQRGRRVVLSGHYSRTCMAPRETRALYVAMYPPDFAGERTEGTSLPCLIPTASTRAPNMRGSLKPSVVSGGWFSFHLRATSGTPEATHPGRSTRRPGVVRCEQHADGTHEASSVFPGSSCSAGYLQVLELDGWAQRPVPSSGRGMWRRIDGSGAFPRPAGGGRP